MSSLQENPWATGGSYISVGGLQRVLRLAENTSYTRLLADETWQQEREGHDAENCASLQQIKCLREISTLNDKLSKLQQDIQWKNALANTADLTDSQSLSSLLSLVEDLCNHLQLVLDKKDNLAYRLQEAYDDHMVIDADYHKDVAECFPVLAEQLGFLSKTIDSIVWTHSFSMKESGLNTVFSTLSSRLAEIQSFYQALNESRSLMISRVRQQSQFQESRLKLKET